ncbi:MAG TPA: GAF domain-containing protein [Pyrinomonadaceae bacterium]|nr:GAF domain-containing protein [Pyrinomonadaceae bacterium]
MSKKILIVEDDVKFRDALMLILEDRDYTFLEASSVREALELIRSNPDVRVVLLDLNLPGKSGTELLRELKGQNPQHRVIVLTAHEELLAAEQAKSYQVFSYAAKAGTSLRQSLRFQIERAFEDLEKAWLSNKIGAHLEIERRIVLLGVDNRENAEVELAEVLNLICARALEIVNAYTCHIRLFDPGRGDFVLWASEGRDGNVQGIFQERVRHNEPYSGIVAETRKPLPIDDLQSDPPFKAMLQAAMEGEPDPQYLEYLSNARSAYVVPISTGIVGNDIDAVFNINSEEEGFFLTEATRDLVHDFVTQTTLAYTKYLLRKRRIEIHTDYKNISAMLEEVTDVLKGDYNLNEIYKIVLKRLSDGLKPEIISIFLFNELSGRLKNVAEFRADTWADNVEQEYSPGEGMIGRIYSSRQPDRFITALRRHVDADVNKALEEEKIGNIPSGDLRHYLGVPMKIGDVMIGVIRAINKRSDYYSGEPEKTSSICLLKGGFSDDCQLELEMAASHLAVAIRNAELFAQINKRVSRLKAVEEVGKRIGAEMDARALQNIIVTSAAEFLHAEICMLLLTNEWEDGIILKQSYGMPVTDVEDMHYDIGEGKTGTVAKTWSPILETEAEEHSGKYDDRIIRFLRDKHGSETANIRSFMAVPIIGEGRILGVIKVINKLEPPYQFDADDLELFQMFASQLALVRFLYTSYSYQKNIVDNSPDPIIFLDKEGRVEVFNKACEQLWGYRAAEVLEQSVVGLYVSAAQARRIGRMLSESADHRIYNLEEEIKTKDGEIIPVALSAAFLFDERGNKTGSMGNFKDLREIKKLQDQVLRAQRDAVVGKLASTIGHDIKHDIGAALNYIGPLLRKCDPKKQQRLHEIYADIDKTLREATTKLKNVFATVQPEPLLKETTYVGRVFNEEIVGSMRRQANAKDIEFILTSPDNEQKLSVDIKQIENVLWNLFDNSIDAIDKRASGRDGSEKGRIEVSAQVKGHALELSWKDNGCGISKDKMPFIFVPFWTDKKDGNGVGLYILKSNIESHLGTVSVDSTAGEGATFLVTIPIAED